MRAALRHPLLRHPVLGRLLGAVGVLWMVSTACFLLIRAVPGDPADAYLGGPGNEATEEQRQAVRDRFGLERPLVVQYTAYLGRLLRGDLGDSAQLKQPVTQIISDLAPPTLMLAALALAAAWVIALVLAVGAARGGQLAQGLTSLLETVAASLPHFWLGTLLILLFAVRLGVLPATSGGGGPAALVLPTLTLALPLAGFLGQVMRESMTAAMHAPFAVSARARGESETGISLRHAVRHAALPAIGLSSWAYGSLIGGAVVAETLFARQGLGRGLLQAVLVRDIPVVLGVTLVISVVYVVVLAIADLLERAVDPRLRRVRASPAATAAAPPAPATR